MHDPSNQHHTPGSGCAIHPYCSFSKRGGPHVWWSWLSSDPQQWSSRNLEMSWEEGVLLMWVSNFRYSPKEHLPSASKALYCILGSRKPRKIKGTNHRLSLSEQLNMRKITNTQNCDIVLSPGPAEMWECPLQQMRDIRVGSHTSTNGKIWESWIQVVGGGWQGDFFYSQGESRMVWQ